MRVDAGAVAAGGDRERVVDRVEPAAVLGELEQQLLVRGVRVMDAEVADRDGDAFPLKDADGAAAAELRVVVRRLNGDGEPLPAAVPLRVDGLHEQDVRGVALAGEPVGVLDENLAGVRVEVEDAGGVAADEPQGDLPAVRVVDADEPDAAVPREALLGGELRDSVKDRAVRPVDDVQGDRRRLGDAEAVGRGVGERVLPREVGVRGVDEGGVLVELNAAVRGTVHQSVRQRGPRGVPVAAEEAAAGVAVGLVLVDADRAVLQNRRGPQADGHGRRFRLPQPRHAAVGEGVRPDGPLVRGVDDAAVLQKLDLPLPGPVDEFQSPGAVRVVVRDRPRPDVRQLAG